METERPSDEDRSDSAHAGSGVQPADGDRSRLENGVGMILDVPLDDVTLEGALMIPPGATGLVLFAHGSGSSRHSPRNNAVAAVLREHGVGTFLFDLLTETEDRRYENRFDIDRLTARLVEVTAWVAEGDDTAGLRLGYFGSSTGAAAALRAAAALDDQIGAVVSRGGRVDLVGDVLDRVSAPTLFVVGERDEPVLGWNREAFAALTCEKRLAVVDGATHLFEEPGALETVADDAASWFADHL